MRLFVRAAPFLLAAVAAVILLRRRLARRSRPAPLPVPVRPVPAPAGFERERAVPRVREPIDIVAVVDDLLAAGRP